MIHTASMSASDFLERRSRIVRSCTLEKEKTSSQRDVVSLPSADWFFTVSDLKKILFGRNELMNPAEESITFQGTAIHLLIHLIQPFIRLTSRSN